MRKLGRMGVLALSMAAMGAALPSMNGNTNSSQLQQQPDRTSPEQEKRGFHAEAMPTWRSSRRWRLSGPDGRYLNQRQRRKRERQSGRRSKYHLNKKKHSSPRK